EARRGALARQPDSAAAQVGLAGFYRHQGRPEEARGAAAAAIAAEPANPAGYVALAEAKRRAADFAGARAGYQAALAQAPDDLAAPTGLATLETDLGNAGAVTPLLGHLQRIAAGPSTVGAKVAADIEVGHLFTARQQYASAEAAYRDALRLIPNAPEAYTGLGEIQLAQKQVGAARGPFEQATAAGPASARAWLAWGAYLVGQKDWAGADAAFARAVALGGGEAAGYAGRARVAEDQGQAAAAQDLL